MVDIVLSLLSKLNLITISFAASSSDIENTPIDFTTKANSVSSNGSFGFFFFSLFILIALFLVLYFYLSKKNHLQNQDKSDYIQVLEEKKLKNSSIYVLKLKNKGYLISETQTSVNILDEIKDEDFLKEMEVNASSKNNKSFDEILKLSYKIDSLKKIKKQ